MADSGAGSHTEKDGAQLSLTSSEKAAATPVQNKTGLPPADCSQAVGITPECRMIVGKEECEHAEEECIGGNEVVIHGDHQAGIVTWEEETLNKNWVPLSTKVNHILEENFKNDINKQFDFEEDDVKLSFNLASCTKVDKETQNETNIRRVDRIQVYAGCFDEKSCEQMNPTEAENQLSFKNDLDGTVRDSITIGKDSKNIFDSPTIKSFIVCGNGIWLIKIKGGKVYSLPFVFATTPKVECFEGFQHINHQDVWYRLNYSSLGKLCLQTLQKKNYIELYEFPESLHGRNETDKICRNGRHSFSNECAMAETLTMLEGFRNSSADTDHKTGGEIVTKTDKKACKRHENDRGETNERDTDEKHNEKTEEKSETGASISFGGNIVNKLQAETGLAQDLNFPHTQMGIHSFMKGFSGGEASHLSGHTDKTNEKDPSQTTNEEVNPLQARSMNFGPLGETNKTILQETSVENSQEKQDHAARNERGQTLSGGTSQMKKEYMSSDQKVIPEGNLSQDASTHYQSHAHEADIAGNFKDTSGLTVAETIHKFSEEETDHTLEGQGETSEVSLDHIYEKEKHHQSISNAEEAEDEDGGTSDGDSASKDPLAAEDQAMHGRDSIPEGRTGLEGSDKIPKYVDKISLSCASASEIISDERPPDPPLRKRKHSTKSVTEKSKQLDTRSNEDETTLAREIECQETDQAESSPSNDSSEDETTLAREIECQETDQAESSTSNDSSEGIEPVLKLLIKYLKIHVQGKKTEADLSKHTVPCSMNLQLMWNFFMLTDCGKKMLAVIAANHHCKVSLSADDNFKEFFIFQVLNKQFHDESDVKLFVDEVLHNIEICAEESLCIDTIAIDPKIQDEVRERIKDGQELANVWVEFVGDDNPVTVYTVCPKDQQQLVMPKITEVIRDATESFNSHKEMVMADFMWQIVMTRFEYLKEFGLKFPSTEIIQDKNKNAFLLKGPRDEVKAVAGHLEELLKMAHKEVHEKVFSPGYQFEIFTSSEMCDYIDKSLPKLPVIWIPNHLTKEIHLFSKDPELFKGMDKSIRGCIEERPYPLSNKHSELSSEQIQLLKDLMKKHGGKVVINLSQSPTGLLLTTADDIFKDVDAAVQTIISSEIDEVHLETFVPEKLDGKDEQPGSKSQISNPGTEMEYLSSEIVSDVVQKITRSLEVKDENIFRKLIIMEHMEKINQIAKEHSVSIKVCETQSKVGFVLKGLEKDVHFIYNAIRLQEQQFQQDISVIAGATGKVHKQMLPNSDAAGKSGGSEMSGIEPVLKLLIKYLKIHVQGKKTEADLSKHTVPCSMNLQLMWNFFMLTDCGKKMLAVIAANHHCKVSLSADDNFKEFFIFQVLNKQFHDESDVKLFVDEVLHNIEICAEESLCIDTIAIDPKIQDEVRERIKDGQELANVWVEFVGDDNPVTVYTVCPKDQQQLVMPKITEVIRDATESFNSHKEMVMADFMWQIVMTRFEYLKEFGLKFPSTEIIQDKNKNAFLLKGPRDEVKAVAGHLEELLKMAHKEVHEKVFSPGYQFEIFTSSEMCDYIDKSLPKLPVIWIPNHLTKEIHLFSKDPELFKGMDKSIRGCIEERPYPLSNKHSELSSEQIQLLKDLMKKHGGKVVINLSQSPTGLLLTTADDIFKDVDAAVQTIISSEIDEVHLETFVPEKLDGKDEQPGSKSQISNPGTEMEYLSSEIVSDVVQKITRSLEVKDENIFRKLIIMEHMEKINQIAKEHSVSIKVCETQSKVGFVLKGLEKDVHFIYNAIRLQEQQFQQDISVIAGATGKVHKQMLPNSDAAGKSGGSEMSGIEPVLKLLIKYLKIHVQGKKTEADLSKHTVPCSMNLQLMWNFFMLTDCGKKMLAVIAANHHCKVSLSADDNFKEFFIFQVLNKQFHDESDVKLFVDEVLHNIEICAEESLCIDTIAIDPKIQDEVRERIKDGQELANVWVEFVGDDNPVIVYTVCPKDQQQLVMPKITEVIRDATESFNSHKEMVMADFMWQIVMTRFEYLKEFGLKFPSTEIIQDKNKNAFLLKGPRDEVKAVAGHLEELLKMAHKEVHEKVFSPGYQFEIFTSSEMCDYIDKSLPKLPVIWIPNHLTKEIHLFSKDPELFKGMDKSIRGCIEERPYPLSNKHSELSSEQIQLLKDLMKKHGGKVVINLSQSPTGLLLTTADDIFKDVDAAVQTIISSEIDEVHLETFVPEKLDGKDEQPGSKSQISNPGTEMEYLSSEIVSDVVQKITRSLEVKDENIFRKLIIMEHMEKINQIAKEHSVSIKVCETQSKVGFVLKGLEKDVHFIYNAIRLQEQQFQQDISVIAGATGKVHKQMLPNSDAAGKSGGSEMSGIEPVLKLLIKYLKIHVQGKKTEADLSKHTVPCSMNLQLMWNFFMLTDCGKKMLAVIAANHHCKVSLSADDNFKEFFIFQVLNKQFHDESDVKLFVDEVLHNIEICAEESLCIDTIAIDPKIQDEVRERIKDGQELANVWVEFVGDDNPVIVYTVCPKDQQQLVMPKITEVIRDATESFNSHKEMVMADFMWQIVMTKFEYLKEFGLKFPSTEIIQDKNKNAFLLKGPRDEVKAVAGHLEELLKMAHKEVHEKVFSPGYQFEIFTSSEMCDYIDKSLPKLPVIWIPNHLTKEIHLFSKDPELFKGMDKSIRGCIEERPYPLSNKHSELSSEQIQLLKDLMKKHGGKVVINLSQSPTGLLLTTADDIFKDVDAAVQTIFSSEIDEVHLETFVPEKLDGKDEQPGSKSQISNPGTEMEYLSSEIVSDVVQKITRSLEVKDENIFRKLIIMEHMEKINQIAKEHSVSIKVCETQSKVGFVLKGLEKDVHFIYNAIRLQEQQFQQDISVIAGASGKVHIQMLPNSDAAGKSGGSEMSGQLLTDPGLASEDGATAMVSCEKIFLVENRSVYECMIKVVRWIKKTGLEHTIEVRELNEPPRVGFVVQGPSDRVLEMTDYMKKVQESIITQKYSAFSVSEFSYLGTTEGKQILAKLEEENNCTIEITYPGGSMGSCRMVTFIFPHDHSVILFNGEVEKCTTDVIVTPVLSPFSSTGPQKTPFISAESTKLSMFVPLCIPKAKHSLIQNICATLCYTGDMQCGKVGFAISPVGGWDLTKYIKIFLYAISDFFCKSQGITGRKVYLCTSDVDIFARMKGAAIYYFSSLITGQNKAGDSYTVDFDASSFKEPSMQPSDPVLHFEKVEVRVETGELSQTKADVIVNTTSENLDLNGGTISKSILKAAGQTIQEECKKVYPYGICPGEVARTSGGRMKCKNIFHGALKQHTSKDWDKILKKFVDACLTLASNMKFKSIAFPALGTGTLELPRDKVAHIMTNCVKEFSSRQSHTLEKVTFVIYHKDKSTLKVFQDTILKFKPAEKEKTESSDFEIHVTGLKDTVNEVIASIKTELKRLTYEDHQASEDKLKKNKGAIPPTISQPSKGAAVEQKSSGAFMNFSSMDYSEEKCCAVVSGEIKSKEELEKDITKFWRRPKHVVYPYDMEKKTALIIFESEEDAPSFLNPNSTSLPYKIQILEPQVLQKLETAVAETIVKRASYMGQMDTLVKEIKEKSGVEVITVGNQVCLKGVTAIQMQIAQSCLEKFCEVNLHIQLRQGRKITSPLCSQDEGYIVDNIQGVSEIEYKALKILIDYINVKSIDVVWKDDAILITRQLESTDIIQTLNMQLKALRGRQMEEIVLDEDYKNVVADVIAEMQSKDAICVYDEEKGQVIMYCVRQDDIRKFKHKLNLKSGKLKETGRSNKRFAENTQSMEASQGNSSSSVRSAVIRHEFSWSKNASSVEIFYTKEKLKVAVYTADILNLPVDCIVNAANERMQHGGGVAKVIADAAGPELVQEGDAIIMKGRIPVGGQVTTTAGRLQYRCIIHTVGPCWSDYQPHNLQNVQKCAGDLYAAIYGCFTEAERNGLSTVALPAVSSGIYAVPQEMCAVQYARAVFDYSTKSEQGKSLTEIHFIDKLPHLVKLMQDTFRSMIKNGNVPNYDIQKYVASSSNYQQLQSKETGRKGHKDGDNAGKSSQYETTRLGALFPIHYESTEHNKKHFVFQISAKPVVHVYDGHILKLKNMNAIVCPDDTKGSGKGAIASELRKMHKYKQQKESCFKLEKPEIGDVTISFGEENPFYVIVHVVIESDSHQKPEFKRTMEKSFDNILRKTDKWVNVKTLAMPLFGNVKNVSLVKPWAELFLDRFAAFCNEVQNPNLAEIHIITHVSYSSAYSTLKNVFCDFAAKIKSAQHLKLPPNSDSKDYMANRGNVAKDDGDADDSCIICMCPKTDPKALSCGHSFCSGCIDQMFEHKPVCPVCGKIVGTLTGDQPKNGKMEVKTSNFDLAGYEGHGSIVITYDFPAGTQEPNHPSPGKWYTRMMRIAYLPNTSEGRTVCRMLQLAFKRRLVFTISQSRTTGTEGLTWNDIHHKTNSKPGGQFGYPDPEYLSRVKDELAAKGITEADLQPEKTGLF